MTLTATAPEAGIHNLTSPPINGLFHTGTVRSKIDEDHLVRGIGYLRIAASLDYYGNFAERIAEISGAEKKVSTATAQRYLRRLYDFLGLQDGTTNQKAVPAVVRALESRLLRLEDLVGDTDIDAVLNSLSPSTKAVYHVMHHLAVKDGRVNRQKLYGSALPPGFASNNSLSSGVFSDNEIHKAPRDVYTKENISNRAQLGTVVYASATRLARQ